MQETKKHILTCHTPATLIKQDHMGAAGLVAEHFSADDPAVISSRRVRLAVKKRNAKDPATVYGNNRGVPVPEWYQEDVLEVGSKYVVEK